MGVITAGSPPSHLTHLVFTYGTLKRGFSNHTLIQSLALSGDASFLGVYRTSKPYPLVCGPYRVPFLLNLPGKGDQVLGELYAVSPKAMERLDELEGISRGHYERVPIMVAAAEQEQEDVEVEVEVYFGHREFAEEMWRRCGEKGFRVYSEKEAMGYVKRTDRPNGVTFLDKVKEFLAIPSN